MKPVKIIVHREERLSVMKKKCEIAEYLTYRRDITKRSSDKLGNAALSQRLIPPTVGEPLGTSRDSAIRFIQLMGDNRVYIFRDKDIAQREPPHKKKLGKHLQRAGHGPDVRAAESEDTGDQKLGSGKHSMKPPFV